MTIGAFSRASRLSAKALRFYHREGLLTPARVDPHTGYRGYEPDQIVEAQVIRHLRSLDMPIELIRNILAAEIPRRSELISEHLVLMEAQLEATRSAVASLRDLISVREPREIVQRSVAATPALVHRATIDLSELGEWYLGGRHLLDALVRENGAEQAGPPGGLWSTELLLDERGDVALFTPTTHLLSSTALPVGISAEVLPAVDLAVLTHRGPDRTMAQAYGELGAHVARHEIGIAGPVRETYLVDASDGRDDAVTEVGWPIFRSVR